MPGNRALFIDIQRAGGQTKIVDVTNPSTCQSHCHASTGCGVGWHPRLATSVFTRDDGGIAGGRTCSSGSADIARKSHIHSYLIIDLPLAGL